MRFDLFNVLRRAVGLSVAVLLLLMLSASVADANWRDRRQARVEARQQQFAPVRNTVAVVREVRPLRSAIFGRRVQTCSSSGTVSVGADCADGSCPIPARK